MTIGQYSLAVNVQAGSLTYVEVAPRPGNVAAVAMVGLVGGMLDAATSQDGKAGTFSLALMDPAAGAALLQELKR